MIDYLLSETHTVGKLKAKFFHLLGFSKENVTSLKKALLTIAHSEEVKEIIETIHGKKYIIDGSLPVPGGKATLVRTVALHPTGELALHPFFSSLTLIFYTFIVELWRQTERSFLLREKSIMFLIVVSRGVQFLP